MECQECHNRPATLHFTQVINGNKMETHVCEVCAKEKGYMAYPDEGYSLHNLLTDLFNFDSLPMGSHSGNNFTKTKEMKCPQCEMTYSEFKQVGKFGCATCYETFSDRIDPILRRVHSGNTKHFGKIPIRKGGNLHAKKQLNSYREEIKRLVEKEAFEDAAIIRDKIKKLELEIQRKEEGDNS